MKKLFYSQKIAPYVFICPFVITVLLFWIAPICNGVLLSFQDVLKDEWVGFNNYSRLLTDKIFYKAVWNSFKYMVGTLVLLIPFPMLFATLLNNKLLKGTEFFKSVYFLPALTSVVVAGTIFRLLMVPRSAFYAPGGAHSRSAAVPAPACCSMLLPGFPDPAGHRFPSACSGKPVYPAA